jgi:predicted nucleotidyltransferase
MRRSSSNSAGADYLDRARRVGDLREAVRRAASRVPSVRRAVLFGSLARGVPTPQSDADLLIVVETSQHAQPRDRVPELLGAMSPLPCPIDMFVLTSDEVDAAHKRGDPLVREALAAGIDLLDGD